MALSHSEQILNPSQEDSHSHQACPVTSMTDQHGQFGFPGQRRLGNTCTGLGLNPTPSPHLYPVALH